MKPLIALCCIFLICSLLFVAGSCNSSQASRPNDTAGQEPYQCLPCGSDCDKATYDVAGECGQCHMQLVKKSSVKHRSIAANEICDYIKKHPDAILLDVRTKAEFEGKSRPKSGTLKNAINIPVQELENKLSSISQLKDKEILVYCSHSQRSPRASYMLTQNGFANVVNMDGGMSRVSDTECKQ